MKTSKKKFTGCLIGIIYTFSLLYCCSLSKYGHVLNHQNLYVAMGGKVRDAAECTSADAYRYYVITDESVWYTTFFLGLPYAQEYER